MGGAPTVQDLLGGAVALGEVRGVPGRKLVVETGESPSRRPALLVGVWRVLCSDVCVSDHPGFGLDKHGERGAAIWARTHVLEELASKKSTDPRSGSQLGDMRSRM